MFSLNKKEFQSLRRYINEIEASYWEYRYDCPKIKRKIPLPTKQDSLYLMFNNQEIEELRLLLNQKTDVASSKLLSIGDIDYTLIAN